MLKPTVASVFSCFSCINNRYSIGMTPLKNLEKIKIYFPVHFIFSLSSFDTKLSSEALVQLICKGVIMHNAHHFTEWKQTCETIDNRLFMNQPRAKQSISDSQSRKRELKVI